MYIENLGQEWRYYVLFPFNQTLVTLSILSLNLLIYNKWQGLELIYKTYFIFLKVIYFVLFKKSYQKVFFFY